MGIDHTGFSPRVQQKIVYAGVENISYQQASNQLAALSDLAVEPKPVERLVKRIGQERIDQRDAAVATHQELPLIDKDAVANPQRPCPAVAMASVDGGRIQMRPEPSKGAESERTSHWRESKVSVLETYQSTVHQAAWERNFFGADRRVFLGDGLPVNWTIQQRHFSTFKPVLDFVHALSYVFAAAFAGRDQDEGAEIYRRWIQAVWSEPGAEAILQLRADYLSETEIISGFWSAREAQASGGRPDRRIA